jgi:hypothetical protein
MHARTVRPTSADRPARQAGNQPLCQVTDRLAPGRGPFAPPQRAPPPVLNAVIGARIDANRYVGQIAREGDWRCSLLGLQEEHRVGSQWVLAKQRRAGTRDVGGDFSKK